jgi:hypothetical protein
MAYAAPLYRLALTAKLNLQPAALPDDAGSEAIAEAVSIDGDYRTYQRPFEEAVAMARGIKFARPKTR